MLQDFACHDCGPFSATTARDATDAPCPDCGKPAPWVMSAPFGAVNGVSVVRGVVEKPASPFYCDTRELGEGMPLAEWKAKRAKYEQERNHQEKKDVLG